MRFFFPFTPIQKRTGDRVMTVAENVGFDTNRFPSYALDGKPTAVDLRRYALDDNAIPTFTECGRSWPQ
jgi:hypothetical protein